MPSKPPILIPQQVLCLVMECRTCYWTVYVEVTLSIGEQTRKHRCERKGSGKLRCWCRVRARPRDHWSLLCFFCFSFLRFSHNFIYGCNMFLYVNSWIIPETVESSLPSVTPASNCCGAGPWSSTRSVSENSMVLQFGNSLSSGRLCMRATYVTISRIIVLQPTKSFLNTVPSDPEVFMGIISSLSSHTYDIHLCRHTWENSCWFLHSLRESNTMSL